nr:MAG TPA: hypothetical protein [Caudoviricetes sp.]
MPMIESIIITQGTPATNKRPLRWKPRRLPQTYILTGKRV